MSPLPNYQTQGGQVDSAVGVVLLDATGNVLGGSITDVNNGPYQGWSAVPVNASFAPGRGLTYVCTAAGTATVTFVNGSTLAVPIFVNGGALQALPYAAIKVVLSNGAAATFGVYV